MIYLRRDGAYIAGHSWDPWSVAKAYSMRQPKRKEKKKSCFSALRKLLGIAQRELLLLFHLNFLHPIARIEKLPSALKNTRKQSKTHILTIKLSDSKKCFWSGRIGTST